VAASQVEDPPEKRKETILAANLAGTGLSARPNMPLAKRNPPILTEKRYFGGRGALGNLVAVDSDNNA